MTVPNDIPGYCQGFRFSDAAEFYNGSNRFLDQSPFGNWDINDCELIAGTPTFDTVLGARALRVDNTSHWGFLPAHAWEGTVLMVAKPFYGGVGATITKYPLLAGTQGTLTSNAALVAQYASTARRFTFQGTGATVGLILTQANDDGRVYDSGTSP